jgi:O-antigen/teichoic acid export membrane protein
VSAAGGISARSASKTVIAQVLGRGVSLVAVVASTAIVARTIGIDAYADWATILALTSLVAFALDPGISPVVVRRLAQDPGQAPSSAALVPLRLGLGLLAYAVVVAVSAGLRGTDAIVVALALGGQVVPRALVLNATPWLQLDHRLHRQTALEAVTAVTGLALLGAAALAGAPVAVLALVGFTGPTTLLVLLVGRELQRTPSHGAVAPDGPPMADRVRAVVHEVAPLAVALLLVATYTRSFVLFLNASDASDAAIARFLFAFQFVEQLIVAAGIVAGAVLPLLALRAMGRALLAEDVAHRLLRAVGAAGALISGGILATSVLVTRLIGGPDLAPAAHDLQLLAPIGATILPAFLLAYVYIAAGLGRRYLWFNLVALAVNVAANAWLTVRHGPVASARISWATEAFVAALALLPVAASGRSGAGTAARLAVLLAAAVTAAELVAAGTVAPLPGGALLCVFAAVVGRADLTWLVRAVLRRPA